MALFLVLPFGLLVWFGVKIAQEERLALSEREQLLTESYVNRTIDSVAAHLAALQTHVLTEISSLTLDPHQIRDWARMSPQVAGVLFLDAKGRVVFPPRHEPVSSGESRFLERTRDLIDKRMLSVRGTSESEITTASPAASWFPFHWNDGLHILLVSHDGEFTRAVELDRARFTADLIAMLPGGSTQDPAFGFCELFDTNRAPLFQWGDSNARSELSVEHPLPQPLGSWRLHCFSAPGPIEPHSASLLIALGVFALGTALAVGGYGIVRSYRQALNEAEERTTFVNQISHELKTPLTNIRMYGELLLRETELDERLFAFSKVIVEESQRLSRLIGNVLTLASQEKGKLQIRPTRCRAGEIARQIIDTMTPLLNARGVSVKLVVEASDEISIDKDVLEQILWNLLSNVEKYAGPGEATVHLRLEHPDLVVTVSDQGPGIPRHERGKIFQEFYRVSNKLTDGVSGAGIGLSLSRALARLHGGDLRLIDSEHGARFEVRLRNQDISITEHL